MKEIQDVEFDILVKFDSICRANGFQYCLAYGTLIGAIRHNGFIPWDDDVDVWMPRYDYDRFKVYCYENRNMLMPYKLCNRSNTDNYRYYLSRFSNMQYIYRSTIPNYKDPDIGVFLDIYPLDSYGENEKKAILLEKKISLLNKLYSIYVDEKSYEGGLPNKVIKKGMNSILKRIYGSDYNLIIDSQIEKLIKKNTDDTNPIVGVPTWETYNKIYPRSFFINYTEHIFNGKMFIIPSEYDGILRMTYGNYMALPPEEKRTPNHDYIIYKRNKND